jgi:N-acetyltransferase 10
MALLPGAFRHFAPALALSLLEPKLAWSEADVAASVARGVEIARADGSPLTPYDLKRLQVLLGF